MAPRNQENIRQRVTVGSLVNQRVRLTWNERSICSEYIISRTENVEGVIRRIPNGFGFTVLTDDNRSVGYFIAGAELVRAEGMTNEFAHLHNYDGIGNLDYSIEPFGGSAIEQAIPGVAAFDGRTLYYSYQGIGAGIEEYRAWQVSQNSWVEVTNELMVELNNEGNRFPWVPGGRAPGFYHRFDAWQRANAILHSNALTGLALL